MKPYKFIKDVSHFLILIIFVGFIVDGATHTIFETSQLGFILNHWYFYFAAIIIFAEIIYWYFLGLPSYKILYVNETTFEEKVYAILIAAGWIFGLHYTSFLLKLIIPAIPGMLPWFGVVAIVILAVYIFFKFNTQKYIKHNERFDKKMEEKKNKKRRKKK